MRPLYSLTQTFIVFAALLSVPASTLARGGGAGGGGGGGGHFGGGGGGGFGGARAFHGAAPGFRGYGAGYRGYGVGYPGFRGYGWGPRYYGWGYPYYGAGLGTGLGLGLGLGLGYGLSSGYGYGYGYPSYAYPYSYGNGSYVSGTYYGASATPPANPVQPASSVTSDPAKSVKLDEFAERGKAAFKSGDYEKAIYALRHAVVDNPQHPEVVLLLGQALFAAGKFDESAGAVQAAMHQLPKESWGFIVEHFQDFYGDAREYTRQLRVLEKAIVSKSDSPALRFLAGYHYGYLGFVKQSIEQLDKAVQIESRDEIAKQLRDEMTNKLVKPDPPPTETSWPPAPTPTTAASWTKSR